MRRLTMIKHIDPDTDSDTDADKPSRNQASVVMMHSCYIKIIILFQFVMANFETFLATSTRGQVFA